MNIRFIDLLRKHRSFLIPFFIFLSIAFYIEAIFSKADLFLLTNQYHSPFWDHFFILTTWLGDGKVLLLVGACLCMVKYRYAVLTLLSFCYTGIVTQVLKRLFEIPRPMAFFEGNDAIRTIPGYEIYTWNSFPSGHSTTAFTFVMVIMHLLLSYRYRAAVICPLALIAIIPRVYLSQHFFQDIVAGSILGTVLTLQMIWWLENSKWYHSSMLDRKMFSKR